MNFTKVLKKYHRSQKDNILGGVCGGLGEFTNIPSWAWRIIFVTLATVTGFGLIPYLAIWVFAPLSSNE